MVSSREIFRVLCAMVVFGPWFAIVRADAQDLKADVALLLKSPDASFSGSYALPVKPEVLNKLISAPMVLAKLWEAYGIADKKTAAGRTRAPAAVPGRVAWATTRIFGTPPNLSAK